MANKEGKSTNKLAVFDPMKAEVAKWKKVNDSLKFDYETPQGNKEARSHIYKLRGTKSSIAIVHKAAKAEALAHCKAVDAEKNWLIGEVEDMIKVHNTPLCAIEERERKIATEKAEVERLEKERIEQERLAAIQKREDDATRKEAELKAEAEAAQRAEWARQAKIKADEEARQAKIKADEDVRNAVMRVAQDTIVREREKFEADKKAEVEARRREKEAQEQAEKQAEFDKKVAIEKAEQEKQKAVETERKRIADMDAAEKAEEKRLAEIEAKRIAKKKHREKIRDEAYKALRLTFGKDFPSNKVIEVISEGHIPHITLNY